MKYRFLLASIWTPNKLMEDSPNRFKYLPKHQSNKERRSIKSAPKRFSCCCRVYLSRNTTSAINYIKSFSMRFSGCVAQLQIVNFTWRTVNRTPHANRRYTSLSQRVLWVRKDRLQCDDPSQINTCGIWFEILLLYKLCSSRISVF